MKRIAIVDLLFRWPPDGGARTDVKEITERLSKITEVKLFFPNYTRYFKRGLIESSLPFKTEKISFNTFTFNAFQVGSRFRNAIEKFKPDIVLIADGWYMKPRLFAALQEFRPWVRFYAYETICLRSHGTFRRNEKNCLNHHLLPSWKNRLNCHLCAIDYFIKKKELHFIQEYLGAGTWCPNYHQSVLKMLENAAGIIVYNQFFAEFLKKYNDNIAIIPSGIGNLFFDNEIINQSTKQEKNKNSIKIGMIGRHTDKNKGFDLLKAACSQLYNQGRKIELYITTEKAITFHEPFIHTTPWMQQNELPDFYRKLDICVVPSLWTEPFGIVALEAMACAKPLIASMTGGLQDIVTDGETGLLVAPADQNALMNAIIKLADDKKLRDELGNNAQDFVKKKYQWDNIIETYYRPLWKI